MEKNRSNQIEQPDEYIEYGPGPQNGLVDYEAFRVVREIRSQLPQSELGYETITFSPEHMHQGILAVAITELLNAFNDGNIPSLTVSKDAVAVLSAVGIPFERVIPESNVVFAASQFARQTEVFELAAD